MNNLSCWGENDATCLTLSRGACIRCERSFTQRYATVTSHVLNYAVSVNFQHTKTDFCISQMTTYASASSSPTRLVAHGRRCRKAVSYKLIGDIPAWLHWINRQKCINRRGFKLGIDRTERTKNMQNCIREKTLNLLSWSVLPSTPVSVHVCLLAAQTLSIVAILAFHCFHDTSLLVIASMRNCFSIRFQPTGTSVDCQPRWNLQSDQLIAGLHSIVRCTRWICWANTVMLIANT